MRSFIPLILLILKILKTTYYEAYSAERKALKSKESDNIAAGADNTFDARA